MDPGPLPPITTTAAESGVMLMLHHKRELTTTVHRQSDAQRMTEASQKMIFASCLNVSFSPGLFLDIQTKDFINFSSRE